MSWHIPPTGELYDRGEDTAVYYDVASGDTHLISRFTARLIAAMGTDTLDTDALIDRLLPLFPDTDQAVLRKRVPEVLQHLHDLEIVRAE